MIDVMDEQRGHSLQVVDLGRLAYGSALERQLAAVERLKQARPDAQGAEEAAPAASAADDQLLLVEHDPPVITIGRGGDSGNMLLSAEALRTRGFDVYESSRGGDVTYHGPGQLVAYPILDLNRHGRDVHRYLRRLEQTVIDMLSVYGIAGRRDEQYTGVWVGQEKVCAIGVAITRWITYHGLALNVNTNLDHFGLIVPCGIRDRGVTSLAKLLGEPVEMSDVRRRLVDSFAAIFGFRNS